MLFDFANFWQLEHKQLSNKNINTGLISVPHKLKFKKGGVRYLNLLNLSFMGSFLRFQNKVKRSAWQNNKYIYIF